MATSRRRRTGRADDPRPSRRSRPSALHPAVGVHDPVRPHRRHRARDVDHPGRPVRARRRGLADPGHLPGGRAEPGADRASTRSKAPINGLYGIEDPATGNVDVLQQRRAVRRHRRRPLHPRHRRLHRHHDEDRRDPGRHRPPRAPAHGHERWMIPILMTVFAIGGHDLRDGRGEPRLLRPRHHGDDRRRLRRARPARR